MEFLWTIDWKDLFVPRMSLPEVLIRGTLIYLALCLLLRLVLKRQAGKVSMSDLLVVSVVAGVCRNPLVRDAYSITDGVLVISTVLLWSFALDWLCYQVPLIHRLLHAPPVALVRDGQILKENLRHELMTESQLESKLRRKGVRGPTEVAEAWMEGDGHVSVIRKQEGCPGALEHVPASQAEGRNGSLPVASVPAPATPEVRAFLQAARDLEAKIAGHREVIDQHQRAIAEAEEMLAHFGFRRKPSRRPARPKRVNDLLEGEESAKDHSG